MSVHPFLKAMFQEVSQNVRFPELEAEVLQFWKTHGIYEESLRRRAAAPRFVFYEGPPTANGMPHPGHCLTRAIKDLFPRYRTMRGYLCERKAGWDTHGLPVEVEVCKELGIHAKEEIEAYGVEPFIQKCQQSVWRYMQQWERLTERLGFWIHLEDAYVTYHQSYVESVWWSLSKLFERGLLYQGHKIVWWWAQGGTALSSGEVSQGRRQTADPSVYVRFPLVDDPSTSLLVWTTTPWTLPSNQFAAVHPDLNYVTVIDPLDQQRLILAEALVDTIAAKVKRELVVQSSCRGSDLIGKRYTPPFDYYYRDGGQRTAPLKSGGLEHVAWRVVAAEFVTTDSGTGVVHQAPAFGEVDYEVLLSQQQRFSEGGPELICAVGPDGRFTQEVPDFQGRWVKEADKDISRQLRQNGLLYHHEQYLHEYPFCWRAEDDPLIQYPRRSWFIRTTSFVEQMLQNNRQVGWLPEHIRDGRFGNFLESNVDWALSRERYWGTPLPIWECEQTGYQEAVPSYQELLEKPDVQGTDVWQRAKQARPEMPDDLKVHKPYIDAVTYASPKAPGARMRRVPEVIDCWYDSGAMPFAQWGYPHRNKDRFAEQFPADFISEAIDQTRGWFYSLMAISTLLFGPPTDASEDSAGFVTDSHAFPHPYRNCIVLGLMLGEDGNKMSKQKRNYREPSEIFDRYGADALRWYFFANQPPWTSIRYSERAIKDSIPEFLLRLWNVYSFFVIYANIDGFDPASELPGDAPAKTATPQVTEPAQPDDSAQRFGQLESDVLAHASSYRPVSQRNELDRWILSELNRTVEQVELRMDAYDNFTACKELHQFVDGLSNWYVRRSRDRFWSEDKRSADKLDAYWTLYECLLTTSKLIAPFVPFVAEAIWRNLAGVFGEQAAKSVHLCDYPKTDISRVDRSLSSQMQLVREIASLGRSARMNAKLKVRQPLAKVEVILADDTHRAWLESHAALIAEELNVKTVAFADAADQYINYRVRPNFKRLGPRVGPLMPQVREHLLKASGSELMIQLSEQGVIRLTIGQEVVVLDGEDVEVQLVAKEGWAAAQGHGCVVVLSIEIDDRLRREGYARDLVRCIQDQRKQMELDYTDRIEIGLETQSQEILAAVEENRDYICGETLAVTLSAGALPGITGVEVSAGDEEARLFVRRSGASN